MSELDLYLRRGQIIEARKTGEISQQAYQKAWQRLLEDEAKWLRKENTMDKKSQQYGG